MPPGVLVGAMIAIHAATFALLALARHRAFWTARFDVGNMWQAIWTTAHGDLLLTTDIAGRQISRLAAHVDPLILVFVPLAWFTSSPEALLVAQAALVSLGAVPAYLLARRWFTDARLAIVWAGIYLAVPALTWTLVDEFHPVTLAAPLLVTCVWAIDARRDVWLAVAAAATVLSKEEVGLTIAMLGLWMAVAYRRRIAGAVLAAASLVWTAFALVVVIPRFNSGQGSQFVQRYGSFGDTQSAVLRHMVTNPWEIVTTGLAPGRLAYLAALLIPLVLLPLGAPLLALVALPELLLNVLASWPPQYSIEFHYAAIPASVLYLAALRAASRAPSWLSRLSPPRATIAVGLAVAGALVVTGPLPVPRALSIASESRLDQYRRRPDADALARALRLVPPSARVSATNNAGAYLSSRAFIATFPVVGSADYVVVERSRPTIGFRLRPGEFEVALGRLLADRRFRVIFNDRGVLVLARSRRTA